MRRLPLIGKRDAADGEPAAATPRQRLSTLIRANAKEVILVLLGVALAFAVDSRLSDRQNDLAERLADRSEVLENVRFVRQVAVDKGEVKPFSSLDLDDAPLDGIPLPCTTPGNDATCADFSSAKLTGASFTRADLRGASFEYAGGTSPVFLRADLRDASFKNAVFIGPEFSNAQMQGANLSEAWLIDSRFAAADLRGADFTNADGLFLLSGADLRGADFTGVDLSGVWLYGADMAGARLDTALLRKSQMLCYDSDTTWPTGVRPPRPPTRSSDCPSPS